MVEKEKVRVVRLQARPRAKSGPKDVHLADVGTVLLVVRDGHGAVVRYILESHKSDGALAWVADFDGEELERLA